MTRIARQFTSVAILCVASLAVNLAFVCGAETTVLDGAIVTLIDHVDVPARAVGPLAEWSVREGDQVKRGAQLGKIDDGEAALVAERAATESTLARREAGNELPVLAAAKAADAAKAELKRAVESTAKYQKSVSLSELDRLKLAADEAELKHRQAIHVRESAELTARMKENESATAQLRLEQHRVTAPIDGVAVEIKRRVGEWVEPGMPVVRLVRLDRLRVETFCDAAELPADAVGRPVELRLNSNAKDAPKYSGRIVFVHPEVNPVNGQVRIWAEVENLAGALRPGMQGALTVLPAASAATRADTEATR